MQPAAITILVGVVAFGGGFVLRPILLPPDTATASVPVAVPAAAMAIPTQAQALEAIKRRMTLFPELAASLGDCTPGSAGPGVMCLMNIKNTARDIPNPRPVGFARVDGRWEVSVW